MITIDKSLSSEKEKLLTYLRERANESLEDIRRTYGTTEYKKQSDAINKAILKTRENIIKVLIRKATTEKWNGLEY